MTCMSTRTQLLTSIHVTEVETIASATLSFQLHAAGTHKSSWGSSLPACRWTHFLNKKKVLSSQSPSTVSLHSWIGAGWTCRHVENFRVYLWTLGVHDCAYVCPCAFGPCAMRIFQGFSHGHALVWMVATGCVTHLVSGWHSHENTSTAP